MAFGDRFRKDSNSSAGDDPTGGVQDPIAPIFTASLAEAAYWRMVSSANQQAADSITEGSAGDMEPAMQAWFIEHAGQPINPTEAFGLTWYLHQDPGNVQLVAHDMLVATGMDNPENQPGTTIWAMGSDDNRSQEALTRKARSLSQLARSQVPTIDHLPIIEDSTQTSLRTPAEVADRAVCLMAVALKAEVFNEGDVVEWHPVLLDIIETFDLTGALSPAERAFVDDMSPDSHTAVQFIWRYESLAALLWSLGHLDSLGFPSGICHVPTVVGIIKELGPEIRTNASLRPIEEILDAADFVYRLHWAVREEQLGRTAVPNVEHGVVMERHHALHWLLASRDEDWDDVDTGT